MISHVFACGMSRSGTTLLTTVLDSHPDVSMGYELLPVGIDDAADAAKQILACDTGDARTCSSALEEAGASHLATLVHRADRTLVSPEELADVLNGLAAAGHVDLTSFGGRIELSKAIVAVKRAKEGTSISGFKLNSPRVKLFDEQVGDEAAYVYIVRDPRDVWRSHVERGFDRTVEQVANAWSDYLQRFTNFARRNPTRAHLVRYEDLVAEPQKSLDVLCDTIGLPRDEAMDRFYESKASVLRGGHANSENLKKDFFTESVGRWREELSPEDLFTLESLCHDGMQAQGYEKVTAAGFRFGKAEWAKNIRRLSGKRKFHLSQYADLVLPAVEAYSQRTWLEATSRGASDDADEIVLIRHDIDHDIENAVRLAHWEAEQGIRATYCVLHTAWYYGRTTDGRLSARSENMVEGCLEIQSLGHEINLHNNTVVVGLRTGRDPYDVLAEELAFLRGRGIDIRGTSTHGDVLCGELTFQNCELFSETVLPSRGGARTLQYGGNEVTIGIRSMTEFGLSYEGYDLPRDVYIADSGGKLRLSTGTRGRAEQTRADMGPDLTYRRIVGILTHPVWWDLESDALAGAEDLRFESLLERLGEPKPVRRRRWWRRR